MDAHAGGIYVLSRVVLPELALVLGFGDAELLRAAFGAAILAGDEVRADVVARRLAARQLCVIDAGGMSKAEMNGYGQAAADTFARVYVVAFGEQGAELSKRTGSMSIMEGFYVPGGERLEVIFEPVSTDRRDELGPFDIIGDVHGCADELIELLAVLGYRVMLTGVGDARRVEVATPPGRRAFFVGDLVDRGPNSPDVMRIVMAMVEAGQALCVAGNHDVSFLRWLGGHHKTLSHGLDKTADQFAAESPQFRETVQAFVDRLKAHLWVDGGRLAVAHAGVREGMIGRSSGKVRAFALYGDTDPKGAADGLPVRYHWALDYAGPVAVVYGHTPVEEVEWVNNTLCIDTGCCFGGRLTALRWPEREVVSVPARATYAVKGRAFGHPPSRPKRD